ncbi:acyltransferase family protein [Pseudogracilibacillus auburnensis]|uniref:Surface polysaccharide O-acyltransferase-like enzyme n=1 Tax=Pseudogracilibacillus auburnensis TaxID=1494959 RepID=A0A2V3VUR0_9BACI|nr:acyltransferase family protein [Pseudogracilibacillus auburnensis]MBO1003880.1 acyltransferase family protein [Pseudogracilibacillus auburnensis]PXW84804.1 surface polysaccharide O-acyltransferase-like enzyme [Pseudogracilibacillus auburnensis]
MKYYNGIDVARVIAAFLVVCVHTDPLMTYSANGNYFLVSVIARLAVPFFFVVSGFFFGKKLSVDTALGSDLYVLFPVLKKLLTIYMVWLLIYLPLQILLWVRSGDPWHYWLSFLQKSIFEGSYYTLWYLTGLMFALAFSYILFKLFKPQTVLFITLILFIIGTLFQSYYDLWQTNEWLSLYHRIFLTTRNGLFFGAFFVSLGIFISKHPFTLSQRQNIGLFFLSLALLTMEAYRVHHLVFTKGSGMWFMLVPTIYFLFKLLQQWELRDQKYFAYLRPFSLLVYVSHGLFLIVFYRVFHLNSVLYFMIVLFGTCLLSAGIIYFSNRWQGLKSLY